MDDARRIYCQVNINKTGLNQFLRIEHTNAGFNGFHEFTVGIPKPDKTGSGDPKTGHLNTGIIQKLDVLTCGSTIHVRFSDPHCV